MRRSVLGASLIGAIVLLGAACAPPPSGPASGSSTTANMVGPITSTDCLGTPTPAAPPTIGSVTAQRTGAFVLVTLSITGAAASTTYSVEIWESMPSGCGANNAADTGARLTTNIAGAGSVTVNMEVPFASLGGRSISDGAGSECLVVVLDDTLSTGSGDRFVTPAFPQPDRSYYNCAI